MNDTAPPLQDARVSRLCSRELPGRDKIAALRELYGRELMRVDLWPHANAAPDGFDFSATIADLGEHTVYAHCVHGPSHMWRSPTLMHDGADDIYLATAQTRFIVRTPGEDLLLPAGGMAIMSKARAHEAIAPWGGPSSCIQVPRAVLARLVPRLEEAPMRLLTPDTPGAALVLGYAQLLAQSPALPASQQDAAVAHVHALLAGIFSVEWRSELEAEHPSAQAPRLALIQRDIEARLSSPELGLAQIARLHHLTPRQVQRLFAQEGTCFSDHVRDARLQRAHAMLADPRQSRRRVLEIAFDCGFADISTFNRAFRRRYGLAPSEVRP
ncbi:MAG: helix-turn-helix transcriptional regulator [Comamonas sp.]